MGNRHVVAVCRSPVHGFSKEPCPHIQLVAGYGVEGDAHAGVTVQHRSRIAKDPTQPNLRQVHLIARETLDGLAAQNFQVKPGAIGENITTAGIDLIALPTGTRLMIGDAAIIEIQGLRNPCRQLDDHQSGLMHAVLERAADGGLIRKAGVMGTVIAGGIVRPGDVIAVAYPPLPHTPLGVV